VIKEMGAIPLEENVVADGNLVTANRPAHASAFAEVIANILARQNR